MEKSSITDFNLNRNLKLKKSDFEILNKTLQNLESYHNYSLYEELYNRNKDGLDRIALFYRGTKITYRQMFAQMREYAKALRTCGVQKDMYIPVCMANIPEFVYLLGAASIIRARLNIFGDEFDTDYIANIIDDCEANVMFVSDDKYAKIIDAINQAKPKNIVMPSLTDSLIQKQDPYQYFDNQFYNFVNKVDEYKSNDSKIISIDEFKEKSNFYKEVTLIEASKLDDELTTTYSSGSTNSTRPKAITHTNRSYITMGTFHDPKVSKTPSMRDLRVLAQIPTHSNTNIMSCITDSLIQGSTVCLEPIYNEKFFLYSLLINKPNFPCATRSFWVYLSKQILKLKKEGVHIKFPFLLAPMSVGEPLSKGEEKFCNKMCRLTDAGIEKTHTPKSVVSMSVAGGDCEHGGIFFIMFRTLMDKLMRVDKDQYDIMRTYSMVDVIALNENGEICERNEIGRLYASSPCNMKEYKNNPEATSKFFKTINGRVYGDCSVYGYIDNKNYTHIKGRMSDFSESIPPFMIADQVLKDTKNVLSCEVIEYGDQYVCHVEPQPETSINCKKMLISAFNRIDNAFGDEISSKVVFRLRTNVESFPLTGCGKRNNNKLKEEGLNKCIRIRRKSRKVKESTVETGYSKTYKLK